MTFRIHYQLRNIGLLVFCVFLDRSTQKILANIHPSPPPRPDFFNEMGGLGKLLQNTGLAPLQEGLPSLTPRKILDQPLHLEFIIFAQETNLVFLGNIFL